MLNIHLTSVENPGWHLTAPTNTEHADFIDEAYSNDDWFFQSIRRYNLQCAGDQTKLVRIFHETLKYFNIPLTAELKELVPLIEFVQTWFANECDEYWETWYGVSVTINKNGQCHIVIDLEETYWEDYALKPIGSPDTFQCYTKDLKFIGDGQLAHIKIFLETFKEWALYCVQLEN